MNWQRPISSASLHPDSSSWSVSLHSTAFDWSWSWKCSPPGASSPTAAPQMTQTLWCQLAWRRFWQFYGFHFIDLRFLLVALAGWEWWDR